MFINKNEIIDAIVSNNGIVKVKFEDRNDPLSITKGYQIKTENRESVLKGINHLETMSSQEDIKITIRVGDKEFVSNPDSWVF